MISQNIPGHEGVTFGKIPADEKKKDISIPDIFDEDSKELLFPSSMVKGTSRFAVKYPIDDTQSWISGVSDSDAVSNAFRDHHWREKYYKADGTIGENVYKLLNTEYFESWRAFASTK